MKASSLKPKVSVFVLFLFLALIWFSFGTFDFIKEIKSKNWPTNNETVIYAWIISPADKNTIYEAEISYCYQIDRVDYHSNKSRVTSVQETSVWVREFFNQIPIDSKWSIHYNSKKPKNSLLELGLQSDK